MGEVQRNQPVTRRPASPPAVGLKRWETLTMTLGKETVQSGLYGVDLGRLRAARTLQTSPSTYSQCALVSISP